LPPINSSLGLERFVSCYLFHLLPVLRLRRWPRLACIIDEDRQAHPGSAAPPRQTPRIIRVSPADPPAQVPGHGARGVGIWRAAPALAPVSALSPLSAPVVGVAVWTVYGRATSTAAPVVAPAARSSRGHCPLEAAAQRPERTVWLRREAHHVGVQARVMRSVLVLAGTGEVESRRDHQAPCRGHRAPERVGERAVRDGGLRLDVAGGQSLRVCLARIRVRSRSVHGDRDLEEVKRSRKSQRQVIFACRDAIGR